MPRNIAIIGGGLSGLSCCYFFLKRFGFYNKDINVKLFERSYRFGGNISSFSENGFVFDLGPKGFLAKGRRTLDLVRDLGLWDDILISSSASRKRYFWENGILKPLDLKSLLGFKLLGFSDFWTIFREYFKRNASRFEDESLADFFLRRFSADLLHRFVELVVTGVYAGDVYKLSAKSIFPRLVELEKSYGSILKGLLKDRLKVDNDFDEQINSIKSNILLSFKGGMGDLVDCLSNRLRDYIYNNCLIDKIDYSKPRILIEYRREQKKLIYEADYVIFATPAFVTASLIGGYDLGLSRQLNRIEYVPLHVICFAYDRVVHPFRGFGFLSSSKQKLKMLGAIWNDSIFPAFAPLGSTSITAMYGGALYPESIDWDEDMLTGQAIFDLRYVMNIDVDPDIVYVSSYKRAIPQYNIGYSSIIGSILDSLKKDLRISLIGNYFNGVGINDVIESAYDFVERFDLS